MTAALKPYRSMKDSGVRSVGQVPAHWQMERLRRVSEMRVSNVDKHAREGEPPVRLCNYVDVYHNDRIHREMPFMAATARPEEIARFGLQPGDVLITKDSEVWNDIGVSALPAPRISTKITNVVCCARNPHRLSELTRHERLEISWRATSIGSWNRGPPKAQ